MSFEIFKQQFGDLTEYVIHDTTTENRCVIIPELGGIVRQLSLRKGLTLFSLLKTPATPAALLADTKSASELLFPFASRIPEGKYKFLGKNYELDKNEDGGLNAIHGLVRKNHFHLDEQAIHADHAYIQLSYTIDNAKGYPFLVHFSVRYTLHADGRFEVKYEAKNNGQAPAPAMFGWHPYWMLGNEDVEAWKINIPSKRLVTFNENLIPVGTEPFEMAMPALLHRREFDNCFIVDAGPYATTELISKNQDVTLRIEQETEKFKYLVVYTPPARDCVAIEPLTANVDSFNTGEGLQILAPGHSIDGTITVRLV
ncbi:aldose 1-epimerase [Dyadobacter fermentans]|uniref:Aldose 1-epimerase n=1 Tax=Dyadobacter fermentans (strain ATCC 700827 / DSM 18053 / CIP 107007 / KCTC 52180 / NS114) TaxID=471854 RepID=C6W7P5_DYAFD|nr:aldose 1-epimerase [Dyadobacter fermentans]ACT96239.1 Aldose 1-epimerase [Dyadobacter fermentans DSM 18053]